MLASPSLGVAGPHAGRLQVGDLLAPRPGPPSTWQRSSPPGVLRCHLWVPGGGQRTEGHIGTWAAMDRGPGEGAWQTWERSWAGASLGGRCHLDKCHQDGGQADRKRLGVGGRRERGAWGAERETGLGAASLPPALPRLCWPFLSRAGLEEPPAAGQPARRKREEGAVSTQERWVPSAPGRSSSLLSPLLVWSGHRTPFLASAGQASHHYRRLPALRGRVLPYWIQGPRGRPEPRWLLPSATLAPLGPVPPRWASGRPLQL